MNDKRNVIEIVFWVRDNYPKLPYHGRLHGLDVWNTCRFYGLVSGANYQDKLALEFAGLYHDAIVELGKKDNEERSAALAVERLGDLSYSSDFRGKVAKLILATKMPQKPESDLEKLICDADLDNLGRKDFFELGENLRIEFGVPNDIKWYETQLNFLRSHEYHTELARSRRNSGKTENVKILENYLDRLRAGEIVIGV